MTLFVWMLGGCLSATEEGYPTSYAQVACSRTRECLKGPFEAEYSDMEDCVDEVSEDVEDLIDECDYDEDKGAECLAELQAASCEDFYDDFPEECLEAYDDCFGG
ncbi:MAG: hypothetical protein ACOZNI_33820 [Myxococcota bacterium]